MEPEDGAEAEEEGPYRAWLPPDDRLWRHPSERVTEAGPSGGPDSDRGGSGRGRSLPGLFAGWAHHPATRIWVVALVAGIVGAVAASGVGMMTGVFEQQTTVVHSVIPSAPTVTLASATASGVDWSSVDDVIASSVVQIQVTSASGPATGSGLLLEPGNGESYVVTDSSLVAGASGIQVSFVSGDQYRGRLVGSDPLSGLALVAVAVPAWAQNFPQLGTVASLRLANPVLAVGARSDAPASVFSGSVTAEDREVDVAGGSTMENLIAVSGSSPLPALASGGPLVDQQGQVVGITVSLDPTNTSDQGLVFAVPVDIAVHVTEQLLSGTPVTHPWLGVTNAEDITSSNANQWGVSGGAVVGQVSPGSPAGRLGLAPNDIITAVNGISVTSSGTLTEILFSQIQPGHPLTLRYLHKGRPMQATVDTRNQPAND